MKLYEKEKDIKKIAASINLNQIKTIKAILVKFKLSGSRETRSNLDNSTLDQLIRLTAE